jgi:advillin
VFEYAQDDLDDQSVMILDSITTLYIWIGKTSKPKDQLSAIKAMQEYLELQKRLSFDLSSSFIVTYAHQEPDSFTTHFHGWATDKIPKEMQGSTFVKTRPALDVLLELECKEYPKDVLLSEDLPDHVDRTRLEHYLSEVEFKEVFSMTRSDYEALPQWKQERLKRQAGFS